MKKVISLFVTTMIFAVTSVSVFGKPSVGYVLVGPKNDGGWSMRHYQGFESLKKHGYKVQSKNIKKGIPRVEKYFYFTLFFTIPLFSH